MKYCTHTHTHTHTHTIYYSVRDIKKAKSNSLDIGLRLLSQGLFFPCFLKVFFLKKKLEKAIEVLRRQGHTELKHVVKLTLM